MTNYVIKKKNKNKKILYIDSSMSGYTFNPSKKVNSLDIKNVKMVDPELSNIILSIKLNDKFNKLLKLVNNYLNNDDAGDADTALVLDEFSMIRDILLNRYQKFLNQQQEALYLKKLRLVENEIRVKEIKIKAMVMEQEERGKSR
jgi:hypothetical protein